MQTLKLNDSLTLPMLGLGTWQLTGETCSQAVLDALEIGYRHIDTAERYENQTEVGTALEASGLARNEYFLTSKLWMNHFSKAAVRPAFEQTLSELKTDHVDLYLLHYPDRTVPYAETLLELQKLKDEGLIKAIGVSNFTIHHLEEALSVGVEIVTNQVEFHPSLTQPDLRKFCSQHDIAITAYSPLGQGQDLQLPVIQTIATQHQATPSQVILAWIRQLGIIAIPKASSRSHLSENFSSQEITLSPIEVTTISALNTNNRLIVSQWAEFDY